MKLSMKADYAFRVLFTLVERFGSGPISIRELAERNAVPKAFLEHIMLELKAQKWVVSLPGKRGGYTLARPPEKITMGEIVRYFDGGDEDESDKPKKEERVGRAKVSPPPESALRVRRVMRDAHNNATGLMDRTTLAAVFAGRPVTREEILAQEFGGGAGI